MNMGGGGGGVAVVSSGSPPFIKGTVINLLGHLADHLGTRSYLGAILDHRPRNGTDKARLRFSKERNTVHVWAISYFYTMYYSAQQR